VTSLVIGSRGSALALWQANHTKARLEALGCEVRLEIVKTQGDKILDVPLAKIGGKGLFVKEIEEALVSRRVDLAVHSMKDVPAELMAGLTIAAVSAREDPRDVLCARQGMTLATLPPAAHIGTSSVRRVAQLRARRPDLRISPLRGNVDTRLRKLEAGEYDGIILAAAGLVRLGHAGKISERLDLVPAIGQGILAFETRAGDTAVIELVRKALHDEPTAACAAVERAFLERLEGGCQTPMACHARLEGGELRAEGLVATVDGVQILRGERRGPAADGERIGRGLAEDLLARGARAILEACKAM